MNAFSNLVKQKKCTIPYTYMKLGDRKQGATESVASCKNTFK